MQGLVKFFNADRGYGFVHNEAGSWWFHCTYCRGELPRAGDTVEFWLEDGTRGDLVAVDVTVVPSDSTAAWLTNDDVFSGEIRPDRLAE